MWCDNCLLVFPLRGGAIAWAVILALYNLAGSLFLLIAGQYLFFFFPEWYIYGGIGMAVCAVAIINVLALSNKSYIWSRVCLFLWPIITIICGIRAIFMGWELNRGKDNIIWECENGGQLWGATPEQLAQSGPKVPFPAGICNGGYQTLFTAFIVSLLVDLGVQLYMFFLNWRFVKRLEKYNRMQGPYMGGYYNA